MEILKDSLKTIGVVVCCVVLFPVIVLCCYFGWAFIPRDHQIAKVKLDNNQTIRVWYKTDVLDNVGPYYYEVTQDLEFRQSMKRRADAQLRQAL